jgi:hypothetical protein
MGWDDLFLEDEDKEAWTLTQTDLYHQYSYKILVATCTCLYKLVQANKVQKPQARPAGSNFLTSTLVKFSKF